MTPSALIVDDDALALLQLSQVLTNAGYDVKTARGGAEGMRVLAAEVVDALLIDLGKPAVDGAALVRHALEARRAHAIFVVTGQNCVRTVSDVMRTGGVGLLAKPVDPGAVLASLRDALDQPDARRTPADGSDAWRQRCAPEIIGDDPALLATFRMIERAADTTCNVLVTGESGTGKELVARALHTASRRAKNPFVPVNCAAIPKELMEAEVFGHVRGAFTGAQNAREGRFQIAEGGTLFLDEIGEMDLQLQAKLLRAVQEKEYTPVGDSRSRAADVRVIGATNQDLEKLCREGRFRSDLYFRLNVIAIELPPLRARRGDILPLAAHFIAQANQRHARQLCGLDEDAQAAFLNYRWPGNIREMANLIERIAILRGAGNIEVEDLPSAMRIALAATCVDETALPEAGVDLNQALQQLERRLTVDALSRCGGNRAKAAELLGLKRTTLVERLRKLNITDPAA